MIENSPAMTDTQSMKRKYPDTPHVSIHWNVPSSFIERIMVQEYRAIFMNKEPKMLS